MSRQVVVELWTGARVVRRLRFSDDDQISHVEQMSDREVTANLKRLGVEPPTNIADQRIRLASWPLQSDLDAIATSWIAENDGVRPSVRVLDKAISWAEPTPT